MIHTPIIHCIFVYFRLILNYMIAWWLVWFDILFHPRVQPDLELLLPMVAIMNEVARTSVSMIRELSGVFVVADWIPNLWFWEIIDAAICGGDRKSRDGVVGGWKRIFRWSCLVCSGTGGGRRSRSGGGGGRRRESLWKPEKSSDFERFRLLSSLPVVFFNEINQIFIGGDRYKRV